MPRLFEPDVACGHPGPPGPAEELYSVDQGFAALMAIWVEERRCPYPTADYLRDRDLGTQADCAWWCFHVPDRDVLAPIFIAGERRGPCGPYPTMRYREGQLHSWYWVANTSCGPDGDALYAHWIPPHRVAWRPAERNDNKGFSSPVFPGEVYAILWLLDNWKSG